MTDPSISSMLEVAAVNGTNILMETYVKYHSKLWPRHGTRTWVLLKLPVTEPNSGDSQSRMCLIT